MSDELLTSDQIRAAEGLECWQSTGDAIEITFRAGNFVSGLEFVNRIGAAAEAANHHPDITLTYSQVSLSLQSHDVGGLTSRDVDLARQINAIAAELNIARHD